MTSSLLNTSTITVRPGAATSLWPQMPAGTLIVNQSSTNGVWVSDTNTVTPGQGFFIGPLGSLTWQNAGPCYAVVDTGVTDPVPLTVGTSGTNPDNPVAVGVAVATQLLLHGIPNVLLEDTIYSATIPAGGNSPLIDASTYASISVYASNPIRITQITPGTSHVGQSDVIGSWFSLGNEPGNGWGNVALSFATIQAFNLSSTDTTDVIIVGSNRQAPTRSDQRINAEIIETLTQSGGYSAGVIVPLADGGPAIPGGNIRSIQQGLVYAVFDYVGGIGGGQFLMTDSVGQQIPVSDFADAVQSLADGRFYDKQLIAVPAGAGFAYRPTWDYLVATIAVSVRLMAASL